MKPFSHILIVIVTGLSAAFNAQIKNIKVCQSPIASELSIAINPFFADQILCGTNSGFYTSIDTGRSWQLSDLSCEKQKKYAEPSTLWFGKQPYFSYLRGRDTNILYMPRYGGSLRESEYIVVNRTPGKVINGVKMFVDEKSKTLGAVWSQHDHANSKIRTDSSFIFYSFSDVNGNNWSDPQRISSFGGDCSLGDSTLTNPDGCTGLDYETNLTWASAKGLMFRNLRDQKNKTEKVVAPFVNGWNYVIGKNNASNGLPSIACDKSNGEFRGRLYICWSDERHGEHNKNVFLIYSDDQGDNWTEPILVTYRPNHKEQFMPRLTIDQSTGYVYILYYDQQNYASGTATDLYLAQSKSGGLKFDYYKINEQAIEPHKTLYYGKSLGISAVNGIVRPLWMQTEKL